MKIETWKNRLKSRLNKVSEVVEKMPQKGDKPEDCQKVYLQTKIIELENAINGTEQEDIEHDNESW